MGWGLAPRGSVPRRTAHLPAGVCVEDTVLSIPRRSAPAAGAQRAPTCPPNPFLQQVRIHSREPTPAWLSCPRTPQRDRHPQPGPSFLTPRELGCCEGGSRGSIRALVSPFWDFPIGSL